MKNELDVFIDDLKAYTKVAKESGEPGPIGEIETLVDIVNELRTALEHYRNDELYQLRSGEFPIVSDNGTTADAALERAKELAKTQV